MIYILHVIILNLMIMFLEMTGSVIMKMINQLFLILIFSNLQNRMIVIKITHDQNLILKILHKKPRSSKFQSFNELPEILNLPKMTLFTTLLRYSLNNQISLCISTNHKPPTETLDPNMIYDHYRQKITVLSFHHFPLRMNIHVQKNQTEGSCSSKAYRVAHQKLIETSIVPFFSFIIDYISCILLLSLCYIFWKKIQHYEKCSPKTESDNPETIATVM